MAPNDRRDVACLALALTVWAAVLAPLIHQLGHNHQHQHATPTLEHHQVALLAAAERPALQVVLVATATPASLAPDAPWVRPFPRVEQPQGP